MANEHESPANAPYGTDPGTKWYRMRVYRFAHTRLRDEVAAGTPRTIAVWAAGRETSTQFDLDSTEWALLIHNLLMSVVDRPQ